MLRSAPGRKHLYLKGDPVASATKKAPHQEELTLPIFLPTSPWFLSHEDFGSHFGQNSYELCLVPGNRIGGRTPFAINPLCHEAYLPSGSLKVNVMNLLATMNMKITQKHAASRSHWWCMLSDRGHSMILPGRHKGDASATLSNKTVYSNTGDFNEKT